MHDPRSQLIDVSDSALGSIEPRSPGALLTLLAEREPLVLDDDGPRRAYADWAPFEDAFIRTERERDRSIDEMAATLERTPGAVSLRLRKLRVG